MRIRFLCQDNKFLQDVCSILHLLRCQFHLIHLHILITTAQPLGCVCGIYSWGQDIEVTLGIHLISCLCLCLKPLSLNSFLFLSPLLVVCIQHLVDILQCQYKSFPLFIGTSCVTVVYKCPNDMPLELSVAAQMLTTSHNLVDHSV